MHIAYIVGILCYVTYKTSKRYVVNFLYFTNSIFTGNKKKDVEAVKSLIFEKNDESFIKIVFIRRLPKRIKNGAFLFKQTFQYKMKNIKRDLIFGEKTIRKWVTFYEGMLDWEVLHQKIGRCFSEGKMKKAYIVGIAFKQTKTNKFLVCFFYFETESMNELFRMLSLKKRNRDEKFGIVFFTPLYEVLKDGNEIFYSELDFFPKGKYSLALHE
jgi:hypothetical protein